MLQNLQFPLCFTNTSEELLRSFYVPALTESNLYQRGVAFFTVSFYIKMLDALVDFVAKGGVVNLVTSVELDQSTMESLAQGYMLTDGDIEAQLEVVLEKYRRSQIGDCPSEKLKLDVIANMIASRHLVVKVAYVPNSGIYHEKIGVFTDVYDQSVSFIGSANETCNAFESNFETINIFSSANPAFKGVVEEHRLHFEKLWNDDIPGLRVIAFPEAVERRMIRDWKKSSSLQEAITRYRNGAVVENRAIKSLWPYQLDAINEFVKNGYRHFFEMATGTGKTFTTIKSIERMAKDRKFLNVVILVPLKDLQRQWATAIQSDLNVRHRVFLFGGTGKDNVQDFVLAVSGEMMTEGPFVAIAICVYRTFFSSFHEVPRSCEGETLLVVDEAHNLTSGNMRKLKDLTPYRLGLSATPVRYDQNETNSILAYFLEDGCEAYRYGLKRAIDAGFLSHYDYHTIEVELTDDENERYEELSRKIGVAQSIYEHNLEPETLKTLEELKIRRSLIVKQAANKILVISRMASSHDYDFRNSVVFCGPGTDVSGIPIIDLTTKAISEAEGHHYFPAKFSCGEDDRPARLENFRRGETDVLVAVKCFDEGMDVPALDKIYLMASDSSRRQTIQRRGRVLRLSRETGKKRAHIYDLVAGRRVNGQFYPLATEIPRIEEYASISDNAEEYGALLAGLIQKVDFDELIPDERSEVACG